LVDDTAATLDRERRTGRTAAHQLVVDAPEGPVDIDLVRVLGQISRRRLCRVHRLPRAAVADAGVVDDMTAGPEPQTVRRAVC
jgi:hypothetical protein